MSGSEIIGLATAVVTFLSTVATSSCCAYIFSRNDKYTIELFKDRKRELEDLIDGLKQKNNGEAIVSPKLSTFINNVEAFFNQLKNSIIILEERLKGKCMCGLLPDLLAQKQARTQLEKKVFELDGLINDAREFSKKPVKGHKQSAEVTIVGSKRAEARDEMWKLLVSNDGIGPIFIHGPLGVGKTAIAKSVHNKALNGPDELFDYVIWVNVEYGAGIWQVQEDIAKSLEINFSKNPSDDTGTVVEPARLGGDDDTKERAQRLKDALLQKGKFLLVLDSLWQPLLLDDIGIPELVNRRKLIVTSRKRTVCDDIKISGSFEIQTLLNENEAWELFKYETGSFPQLKSETISSINRALLSEFDGLPLAISNLAQTLGNIKKQNPADLDQAWMEELDALPKNSFYKERKLFSRFKHSYDNLEQATKPCFLYCAFFPKDYCIESRELIEYWMWEGLLGEFETLEGGIEKGRVRLKEITNAHLLQSERGKNYVKMLNFVRSMAIDTMVNEEKSRVFIRAGCSLAYLPLGLEWPSEVEKASFMQNQLKALKLRKKTNCTKLSVLLLQDNSLAETGLHHDKFFDSMTNLKVLDLSRTDISSIPTSLSKLINLHVLLLRKCKYLSILPDLSQLEKLIVLDLSGTALEHCPKGIQNMKKLRRLDLSETRLETFPPDIVHHLTNLEELLSITDYDCVWGSNPDEQQQIKVACVEDLVKIPKLSVLQLHFQNTDAFNKYVSMAEVYTNVPSKFRFRVGEIRIGGHAEENSLTISGSPANKNSELVFTVASLQRLRNLHVLDVYNFNDISYLFDIKILTSLTMLRVLVVRSCKEMVNVLQPGAEDTVSLTKMIFFDLPKLKSICGEKLLRCPNLSSIDVWRCENLKLPLISSETSRPRLEIRVVGEKNWIKNLKSYNPASNTNLRLVEATVPLEFTAVTTRARKKPQADSSNTDALQTNNTYANTMLGFGALKILTGLFAPTLGTITPSNVGNFAAP